ncbi:MAG TPA: glycosyltransferase family 2 protein [Candidatus Saccharimonadales bacterium]|jgi:cellulose synthase/poly-beta-1,6-N-acetylglucosamine synthase-like glycosyltransferase|nr:glycosyltransferase family 2 protein [Candidatus Saccharimonadales bacterium]
MDAKLLEVVFTICFCALAYHYAGYPVLLFFLAQLSQMKSDFLYLLHRASRRSRNSGDCVPRVAVLVSAYNEEAVIEAKVRNSMALDYPSDRIEFLFGLDAPADSTAEILGRARSNQVRVMPFEARRGKLAVLCDLAQNTDAEILVLTDANTMLNQDCIRNLVRHFADPRVGAVSGEEVRVAAAATDPGAESLYWRYESALKVLESRLNCSMGGNGAALAVRHSLFHPRPKSIVEDFQVPLDLRFNGYRVIYDPEAVATEEIAPTFSAQFERRVRIAAGNYQTLFRNPAYLNPLTGRFAFAFLSHRLLRWLAPVFLPLVFFCSLALVPRALFSMLAAAQSVFYLMAVLGYRRRKQTQQARWLSLPLHFCSMNLALLFGLFRYLRGRQALTWKATPRVARGMLLDNSAGDQ